MSPKTNCCDCAKVSVYAVTFLAVLLIGYLLMHGMRSYLPKTESTAKRAAERSAARVELEAAAAKELNGLAAELRPGIWRLPISRAMELAVQGYKNGTAFRTNLLARAEKAAAPLPKAPEKPSEFE